MGQPIIQGFLKEGLTVPRMRPCNILILPVKQSLTHGADTMPGTFPTGTPDVLLHEASQSCLSLAVGQNPV